VTKYRLLKIHIPELWTHLIQNLLPKKYIWQLWTNFVVVIGLKSH
jgi:hypothetical protein